MLLKNIILNQYNHKTEKPPINLSQELLSTIKDLKSKFYNPDGTVNYTAIKNSKEFSEYRKLSANLINYDLTLLNNKNETIAFWINLYNAIVIDGIVTLDIKHSIREVLWFLSRIKYNINGYHFSPNDIEHGILRANSRHPIVLLRQFSKRNARNNFSMNTIDPRIHFALVCGSNSCPPIKFYTTENINNELEHATSNFINSPEVIAIPNKLLVSPIFKWYMNDFGGKIGVLSFIEKYLNDDDTKKFIKNRKNDIQIKPLKYNWTLNA